MVADPPYCLGCFFGVAAAAALAALLSAGNSDDDGIVAGLLASKIHGDWRWPVAFGNLQWSTCLF